MLAPPHALHQPPAPLQSSVMVMSVRIGYPLWVSEGALLVQDVAAKRKQHNARVGALRSSVPKGTRLWFGKLVPRQYILGAVLVVYNSPL